jgi:hypothetical protein
MALIPLTCPKIDSPAPRINPKTTKTNPFAKELKARPPLRPGQS